MGFSVVDLSLLFRRGEVGLDGLKGLIVDFQANIPPFFFFLTVSASFAPALILEHGLRIG